MPWRPAPGREPLMAAIQHNNPALVQLLLASGFDVRAPVIHSPDRTPLEIACLEGFAEVAEVLIAAGADPQQRPEGYDDLLELAVMKGKHQLIKPLLTAGAKGLEVHRGRLTEADARASGMPSAAGAGWTLLALASAHGHTACVRELLAAGADINAISPIQFAVRAGHAEVVEVLLDHAARNRIKLAQPRTWGRQNTLHAAAQEVLPQKGCSQSAPCPHTRCLRALFARKVCRGMLEKEGASLDTPLNLAIRCNHWGVASALLEAGASTETGRFPPLSVACMLGLPCMVELLLDHGARAAKPTSSQPGPLSICLLPSFSWPDQGRPHTQQHVECGRILLARGAVCPDELVFYPRDVPILPGLPEGLTVLQVLISEKRPLPWIGMLLDAGAAVNGAGEAGSFSPPLLIACAFGNAEAARELLSRGADVKARSIQGLTALEAAAKHPECMRQVLEAMHTQLSQHHADLLKGSQPGPAAWQSSAIETGSCQQKVEKKSGLPPLLRSERIALYTASPLPDSTKEQCLALVREYAGRDGVIIVSCVDVPGWQGVRRAGGAEGQPAAAPGADSEEGLAAAPAGPTSGGASSHSSGAGAAEPQPSPSRTCSACGAAQGRGGGKLKLCSACRAVYFCSVECQRQAWPEHRKVCGK